MVAPVTWLPTLGDLRSERDEVFGVAPDAYEHLRQMLGAAWRITDARALDLCRLRVAQMMGARAELAGADPRLLAGLEDWRSNPALSGRERAALSYAEQYHFDHTLLGAEQKAALADTFSRRGVVNFVWALHVNDAYARALTLLDIAPDPPSAGLRPERDPSTGRTAGRDVASEVRPDDAKASMWELKEPEFSDAQTAFGRAAVRQRLIDEVTSEAVRLHNANHQGCLY
jgi:alkylhydroperoxidase family enzyme